MALFTVNRNYFEKQTQPLLLFVCGRHGSAVPFSQTKPTSSVTGSDVSHSLPPSSALSHDHASMKSSTVWPTGGSVCPFHNLPTEWWTTTLYTVSLCLLYCCMMLVYSADYAVARFCLSVSLSHAGTVSDFETFLFSQN